MMLRVMPRTICQVLREIKHQARKNRDESIVELCNEATDMARRMQAKLVEYSGRNVQTLVGDEWLSRAEYKRARGKP